MPPVTPPWRSLAALADDPAVAALMAREFPAVTDLCTGPDRRRFLKLMAASLAMAGLSVQARADVPQGDADDGRTVEVPYVRAPVGVLPGALVTYASTALLDGIGNGVLVTTRDGRPLKIEGNPAHPFSRGGTDVFAQASVLELYDPDRSQSVLDATKLSDWPSFRGMAVGRFAALRADGGAGLRLLTGPVSSPTVLAQIAAMQAAFPQMVWHSHDPAGGSQAAQPRYRFGQARVVVALDGDLLDTGPGQAGVSRDWADARAQAAAAGSLLELHAASALPSLTSAKADYPLVAAPAELLALVDDLLAAAGGRALPADHSPLGRWRTRAAAALLAHRGAAIVCAGRHADPRLTDAVQRLNEALGNEDSENPAAPVFHTMPAVQAGRPIAELAIAMHEGQVAVLVMLDVNPAYDAPGSLRFDAALARVKLRIHAGQHVDETAIRSTWHLPLAHPLEAWGDARALDGTICLIQPTIERMYDGVTAQEVIAMLVDPQPTDGLTLLRRTHAASLPDDAAWARAVQAGFIADTALPPIAMRAGPARPAPPPSALTVLFRPDPTIHDGRPANNGWLQELPKPLTKIVWDNVVSVGPGLAARLHIRNGDIVSLEADDRQIEGPAWVQPGQSDAVVGLTLGYGRAVPDRVSSDAGFSAYPLRDADSPWAIADAAIVRTNRTATLATTQDHATMEGQDFIRVQRQGAPPVGETASWHQPSLYPAPPATGTGWGMVIDLDACTGCNACVVACQSENNIAVVGRDQVALGREMHWLRVDRYYEGPPEAPVTRFQPVPCMHCEQAPCEVGCPVEATVHDSEGLNTMVYNRCIGTRACSGYCPYKVRHFNYLDYSAGASPSLQLQRNPQVTVRARGVMEKCTYCVQRIESARIDADKADGTIADGTVRTACQGACPTSAISFGDLHDPASHVAIRRADPRNYALLGELGTRPRTSYLAARAPADAPDRTDRA